MGKTAIISAFVCCLSVALTVFFSRETRPLRENLEKVAGSGNKPRLLLDDFTLRRFNDHGIIARLRADNAFVLASDVLNLRGNLNGWQLRDGKPQTMRAKSAKAVFHSDSLAHLVDAGQLETVYLEGDVELGFADHVLTTDRAKYFVRLDVIVGDAPVRVHGPQRWFTGKDGFKLQLGQEALEVFGPVEGTVKPQGAENGGKNGKAKSR